MLRLLLNYLATGIFNEALLLAEHADLRVACLKWPKTTVSQAWDGDVWLCQRQCCKPMEPVRTRAHLRGQPQLCRQHSQRNGFRFIRRVAHQWHPSQTSQRLLACTGSSSTAQTQLKIAAGDISSPFSLDFDISDQGILSHQKLTKAEFGTNAKIATSVRVKDLPSTAACSIRIGLRQIPTSRQASAKSISFEATSCRMLLGHAFAQYWDKPAANLDGVPSRDKTSFANGMNPTALN